MSVRRHTSYNLIGSLIPLGLALVSVPLYLRLVGPDRYGVLAIAWVLLGYFGLFDLGLGRATSFRIAALHAASAEERSATFWSALAVNIGMGLVGAVVLWIAAYYFYAHPFKVSEALRPEILSGVPLLAASVPVATITGVLTGALQGRERFLETNVVSTISTVMFHLLPLSVAATLGPDIWRLLAAALAARLFAVIVLGWRCIKIFGHPRSATIDRKEVTALLKYGGWVNLTSIFGPLLVFVDRFAIGTILGAGSVAIYTVPYQLTRLVALLPSAFLNALFPKMSGAEEDERYSMASRATQALISLISPLVLLGVFGLGLFLHFWVGETIAAKAAPIGRVLLVGFWMNAFALIPFTSLQASGRPDMVTKILLLEIPFYLVSLYVGLKFFGLMGCVIVFAGRCMIDYLLLAWAARRSFEKLPLLAANLALLVAALVICDHLSIGDARFWAAATAVLSALLIIDWRTLPRETRTEIGVLGRRVFQRVTQ